MPDRCKYSQPLPGGEGRAWAIDADGRRRRLTKKQLADGELPEGAEHVIITGPGHHSTHRLQHGQGLLRLSGEDARALLTEARSISDGSIVHASARANHTTLPDPAGGQDMRVSLDYHTYRIAGQETRFGGVTGAADSTRTLPRNPYVIAGAAAGSAEGRAAALAHAHAVVALAARERVTLSGTPVEDSIITEVAHLIPSRVAGDSTYADALLAAAAAGDRAAAAALQALSVAGEALIAAEAREQARVPKELIDSLLRPITEGREGARRLLDERIRDMDIARSKAQDAARELQSSPTATRQQRAAAEEHLQALEQQSAQLHMLRTAAAHGTAGIDGGGLTLVHETAWPVEYAENGDILLRPRGDHEPDRLRDTLHMTVNHLTTPHLERSGDMDKSEEGGGRALVIDMRALNSHNPGAINRLNVIDTSVTPPAREPIRLPAEAVTIIEYDGMGPGQRKQRVEEEIRARGGRVFQGGTTHSDDEEAVAICHVLAANLGVPVFGHNSGEQRAVEIPLAGTLGDSRPGKVPLAGPMMDPEMAWALGVNGRLRVFDRGGEAPYGRPTQFSWTGTRVVEGGDPNEDGSEL